MPLGTAVATHIVTHSCDKQLSPAAVHPAALLGAQHSPAVLRSQVQSCCLLSPAGNWARSRQRAVRTQVSPAPEVTCMDTSAGW